MNALVLSARLLHVGLGVFWVGAMLFSSFFLLPAMRDAGPDGAKVAAGLMRRGFMNVMPVVALLTVLSGVYLYWFVSGGFQPAYMGSRRGITYGLGAVASIVAFALGVGIMRPAMLRAAGVSAQAATADADARERAMREAQALRARAGAMGRIIAWLLILATITMAIGRYL